ncbi:uncharacterized protein LOC116172534 [Photinus pyralis]|uniref:uncharacterized protein LOC116172534 n=1 Tax=Photinus pyralis TaxID=7054 RepID=UPI0012676DA3|nr:uncharacterized protein LOC116172534 [Photinus pyralis]
MPKDDIQNGKLVEAVQKYPFIYNFNLDDYCNRDKVNDAWERVASEVGGTVKFCKETWRNLRTVFARNLKKPHDSSSNRKKYYLFEKLQFLKPYLKVKQEQLFLQSSNTLDEFEPEVDQSASSINAVSSMFLTTSPKLEVYDSEGEQFTIMMGDSRTEDSSDMVFRLSAKDEEYESEEEPPSMAMDEDRNHEDRNLACESGDETERGNTVHNELEPNRREQQFTENASRPEVRKRMDSYSIQKSIEPPKKKRKIYKPEQRAMNCIKLIERGRENYRRHFLLSLLPDLEEMNMGQFRVFRQRVCQLIDAIVEPHTEISQAKDATPSGV